MKVDSFRFVPPLFERYYRFTRFEPSGPIPWTPLGKPLPEARLALVTTGGLYHRGRDLPFDGEREKREPAWGDPSFRALPTDMAPADTGVAHLHIDATDVLADRNILLPIDRVRELVDEGRLGSQAASAYSFMGYQGYPADLSEWRQRSGPAVRDALVADRVDAVLLTSA